MREVGMWGHNANCYAYACRCRRPVLGLHGAAVPGGFARQGVYALPADTAATYAQRLVNGVILDAAANGVGLTCSFALAAPPANGTGYVFAMLSNAVGFHFLRRGLDGAWRWKDGHGADREKRAFSIAANATIVIDDAHFQQMVHGNIGNYIPNWPNMTFRAYFTIASRNGMTVSGIANAAHVMP
jgi:hypothetical protein